METVRRYRAFKESLASGEAKYGTMLQEIGTPNIVKILAEAGMDFCFIDGEHGPYTYETVSNLVSATDAARLVPIVRIPEIRKEPIQKFLDAGAAGILVPWVRTAAEVQEAVRLARYAPEGCRGFATFKPWSDYATTPPEAMLAEANRAVLVVVQVETREAVESIDDILAVKGCDALLVGPGDLSLGYGMPGRSDDPVVVAAIKRTLAAARRAGKPCGIHCSTVADIVAWRDRGMRLLSWSAPITMVYEACLAAVKTFRPAPARPGRGS